MSWQAMDAVDQIAYDHIKPLAYRVLLKLANVAAQDGTRAFRSKSEMADELGVSERSIQRAFHELELGHYIRRGDQRHVSHLRGDRRPTVYDVNMRARFAEGTPPLDGETDGETGISTGETDGETTGVFQGTNGTTPRERKEGNHRGGVSPLACGHAPIPNDTRGYCVMGCAPVTRQLVHA